MKTDRVRSMLRVLSLSALAAIGAACSTPQALREALPGAEVESPLGGPMAGLERLPYASMLLRVGDRFQALLLLGHVNDDGVQTWYGIDGLALQLQNDRVIHSRGLPLDILDSHVAGIRAEQPVDCSDDSGVAVPERLHYTRFRDQSHYFVELSESVTCTREAIVTPAYSGPALRIDEQVALLPDPRRQTRTRWLAEGSGQLLRVEYGDHPWYPELALYLIRPVGPR